MPPGGASEKKRTYYVRVAKRQKSGYVCDCRWSWIIICTRVFRVSAGDWRLEPHVLMRFERRVCANGISSGLGRAVCCTPVEHCVSMLLGYTFEGSEMETKWHAVECFYWALFYYWRSFSDNAPDHGGFCWSAMKFGLEKLHLFISWWEGTIGKRYFLAQYCIPKTPLTASINMLLPPPKPVLASFHW